MNFFGLIKKQQETEIFQDPDLETEISDSENDDIHIDEYVLGLPLFENIVFNGIKWTKHITLYSKIKNEFPAWQFNRDICNDHIENIKKGILSMEYKHIMGSFKIAKSSKTGEIKLLDGQSSF
jgi:hypothetical protein